VPTYTARWIINRSITYGDVVTSWVQHSVSVSAAAHAGIIDDTHGDVPRLAVYCRPPVAAGLLVCAHATGLHAHVFATLAKLLAEYDLVAYDARGHGASSPGPVTPEWDMYGTDARIVTRWARQRALRPIGPVVGVGHSMGATALVMAALVEPTLFDLLIVVEPIIFPPRDVTPDSPLAAGARRRRTVFPSLDAARENYAAKPPLNELDPRVLRDYVHHGFVAVDGGYALRCAPEYEARTYEMGVAHDTWQRLDELLVPTLVLAGRLAPQQPSALASDIASRIPSARFERWDDAGHFAPLERPERFADLVRREVEHLAPTIS
jgi:pimeloyl-ACP methyl ester carboxylesterase